MLRILSILLVGSVGVAYAGLLVTGREERAQVCYNDGGINQVGCFDTSYPWEDLLAPKAPNKMGLKLTLYSAKTPNGRVLGEQASSEPELTSSLGSGKIHLLVHGFGSSDAQSSLVTMRKNYISAYPNDKVIAVNWANGAKPTITIYNQAVSNTRVVGRMLGNFMSSLSSSIVSGRVSCEGHSLGSHVCGYMGKWLKENHGGKKMVRIVGFDPAGPYFDYKPAQARLDYTDAKHVTAVHTSLTLGYYGKVAHYDFFVAGGKQQPGCPLPMRTGIDLFDVDEHVRGSAFSCSHERPLIYWNEGLLNSCKFPACQCSDYTSKDCSMSCSASSRINMVAQHTSTSRKQFYVDANKKAPHCKP